MDENGRIRQLLDKLSIPRGMWVAIYGQAIITTGSSRSDVEEVVSRMRENPIHDLGDADVIILENAG